jgi:hypothetical protein|tara:strand:+ start:392 stop:595 length:204 start_codon:yes stop_codon:yes gene_type:complete
MKIKTAKYIKSTGSSINECISIDTGETVGSDGKRMLSVPIADDNTDYLEIMRQVDAGELTIEPADTE